MRRRARATVAMATCAAVVAAAAEARCQGSSFALPQIPAGMNHDHLRKANLNGDAYADFVLFDETYPTLGVLAATGPATYAAPVLLPTPFGGRCLTVADVNLDGFSDALLTAPSTPLDFATFLGDGAGSFLAPVNAGISSGSSDLAVGDVNGDGKPDAVTLAGLFLRYYPGTGTGAFGPGVTIASGSAVTRSLAVGDLDQDGFLDLLYTGGSVSGFVTRKLGNGAGGFGPGVNSSVGPDPGRLLTADLNVDGAADIAVANLTGQSVSVMYGAGNGTFLPTLTIQTDPSPWDIEAADLDNDGLLDLATPSSALARVRVLTGVSPTGFYLGPSYPTGSAPFSLEVLDLDGNGTLDFAAALSNAKTVALLRTDAAGAVKLPVSIGAGLQVESVVSGDLDGDGFPDLLTADSVSDTCTTLLWHGDGTFVNPISNPAPGSPQAAALADFDGDARLDAVTVHRTTNELRLRLGNGTGVLTDAGGYPVGVKPQACQAIDFNADGKMDASVANAGSGTVSILMGDGAGAFPQNNAYAAGVDTRCLAAGDVNGDGLVDVAAGNQVSATVTFYLGTPGGTPGLQFPALAIAPGLYGLVAADFDRDGHCDLATNRFEVWSGNGAGVFTLTSLPPVGNLVAAVAADDVNADGYLDLLTANYDHGSIGVVPGSVNGFSAAELYAADPTPVALGTRDLDLDGRPDWFAALLFMNSVCASLNLTAAPVGLTPYGAGTSGCHGTLSLLANGPPQIPAPGFLLTCTNAPSNAFGLLLVANASSPSGVDPFGIGAALHVDPFASTEFFGLDMFGGPAGTAHAPAPIPNAPALSGAVYFAQALFLESPGLTCGPSPFRIVSSRGLAVQIP